MTEYGPNTPKQAVSIAPREEPLTGRVKTNATVHLGQLHTLHSIVNYLEDGLLGSIPRGESCEGTEKEPALGVLHETIRIQLEVSDSLSVLESRLAQLGDRLLEG